MLIISIVESNHKCETLLVQDGWPADIGLESGGVLSRLLREVFHKDAGVCRQPHRHEWQHGNALCIVLQQL